MHRKVGGCFELFFFFAFVNNPSVVLRNRRAGIDDAWLLPPATTPMPMPPPKAEPEPELEVLQDRSGGGEGFITGVEVKDYPDSEEEEEGGGLDEYEELLGNRMATYPDDDQFYGKVM